jgi:hypothetical protein
MKKSIFNYGSDKFEYYLLREERKTLRLTVYPNLKIVLFCPLDYSEEKIVKFLKRKYVWLKKQIKEFKRLKPNNGIKEYVSGESFLYLGRQHKLIVKKTGQNKVQFKNGEIILETKNINENKQILEKWYINRANKIFKERYNLMLKKFNYNFTPDLAIRKMNKRWGSFLTKKKILLNPELIKTSKECIDYVIAHELCHMKHQNHSKAYYRFLSSKCHDWKTIKEKLELRFT